MIERTMILTCELLHLAQLSSRSLMTRYDSMDFRITSKLLVWAMLLSSSCVLCERLSAKSYTAQTVAQFEEIAKQLVAGDELVMKDGLWRDANLLIQGEGTAEQPITIRAATPGKVVLTAQVGFASAANMCR